MKKVFIIGFNRTATKALHVLFKDSGYLSAHYSLRDIENGGSIIMAEQMKENLESYKPILYGMDHIQVISDMFWHREDLWIDGVKYFKELHNGYPDAYFILNTRPMVDWLASKENHKKGAYISRCMQYHKKDKESMLDWFAQDREETHQAMREYFQNNDKFIEFNVKNDDIQTLIDFMKPEFFLDKKHWKKV